MKMEHSVRQRQGELNAEASRGKRQNVADHTPIRPSHSPPAHVRSSLRCSVAVPETRWLQGQSSQALHYFSDVQQVRLLLWITFLLPPALVRWLLWEPRRSRHLAPSSASEAASLSTPCKTDTALTAKLFTSVPSRRDAWTSWQI